MWFSKGISAQHYLLVMIYRWKKAVDSNKVFGGILTNLSKAFGSICHDLLVAKLHAYGLSLPALKRFQDDLLYRKQKKKVDPHTVHCSVPQGSI